jgi:hypothetical protein
LAGHSSSAGASDTAATVSPFSPVQLTFFFFALWKRHA